MTSVVINNQPVKVTINQSAREIRVAVRAVTINVKPVGVQGVPGQETDPGDLAAFFASA